MKKLTLLLLYLVTIQSFIFSQDIITKKNGDEIECKVMEIAPDLIKYKKYNNQDGPIYNLPRAEVFMIKYENGEKDMFNEQDQTPAKTELNLLTWNKGFWGPEILQNGKKLNSTEVRALYSGHNTALSKYNGGKTAQVIGPIISWPCAFIFGWQLGTALGGGDVNSAALIIGGAGMLGGIIISSVGDGSIKKSVELYNTDIRNNQMSNLQLQLSNDGIGLCYSF